MATVATMATTGVDLELKMLSSTLLPCSSDRMLCVPAKMSSLLEGSSSNCKADMRDKVQTKCICTIGPSSSSLEMLIALMNAGMTAARFDLTYGDWSEHRDAVRNLKEAVKRTGKMCAIIVDTPEPSLKVVNVAHDQKIELFAGQTVTLTTDTSIAASAQFLPVNSPDLTKYIKAGERVFIGMYLATGSDNFSAVLQVEKVEGNSVICICSDNAKLDGGRIMVNLAKYRSEMPSIFPQEEVEAELARWDQPNLVDFVEISCIRTAADVIEMRNFLNKTRYMKETKIIAKIESRQGLAHFIPILEEADGIMLSRGDLGLAIPIEKIVQAQKYIVRRCNLVAKPVIVTRVLDSMVNVPAPTRAEATDVANAVLDGVDAVLLGAETVRGAFPVATVRTVLSICKEAESVFNKEAYSKYLSKNLQSPMPNTLAVAASAVRAASKVKARLIICFTSTGKVPRLTASFRPNIPILSVVLPTLSVGNNLRWTASGAMQARQTLLSSGLIPILADPRGGPTNKHLHDAFQVGKKLGLVRAGENVVITQRMGNSRAVAIVQVS